MTFKEIHDLHPAEVNLKESEKTGNLKFNSKPLPATAKKVEYEATII